MACHFGVPEPLARHGVKKISTFFQIPLDRVSFVWYTYGGVHGTPCTLCSLTLLTLRRFGVPILSGNFELNALGTRPEKNFKMYRKMRDKFSQDSRITMTGLLLGEYQPRKHCRVKSRKVA
jgi:hypothetical protein